MKKSKKSERVLINKVTQTAKQLKRHQRGLEIGPLMALIRNQLRMSQRTLAKRAKVPQSTISKIESGRLEPNIATLKKILSSMECDLLITAVLKNSPEHILQEQALLRVKHKMQYLQGTMSLEKQDLSKEWMRELVQEEVAKLLNSTTLKIWEED